MTWTGLRAASRNEIRKKSPNPTRYMRTRIPTSPMSGVHPVPAPPPPLDGEDAEAGVREEGAVPRAGMRFGAGGSLCCVRRLVAGALVGFFVRLAVRWVFEAIFIRLRGQARNSRAIRWHFHPV